MKFSIGLLVLALTGALDQHKAIACDPNEGCGDVCAFGVCAHDYACESRKAACHVPWVGPAIVDTPGSPLAPGGPLGKGGPGLGPVSAEDLKKCLKDPSSCGSVVIGDVTFSAIQPIVSQYISYLDHQADGKRKSLPEAVITKLQPYYPEINLRDIRYAENIDTVHGSNMTVEKEIFFTQSISFTTVTDSGLLAHELQHSVQYENRGGREGFLAEYLAKGAGQIIAKKSFSVHDDIDFERDAIAKATAVMASFGWMALDNGYWRYSGGPGWAGIGIVPSGNLVPGTTAAVPPSTPANSDRLPSTQWIALQDPGSSTTFFKVGNEAIKATALKVGDVVYADRDINVRHRAADWKDKPSFILPRGTRVHINEIKSLEAGSATQLWGSVDVDGDVKFE
jgi:Domain of unknown function (DUF4157)